MTTDWEERKSQEALNNDWLSLAKDYNTLHRPRLNSEIRLFADKYYNEITKYAKLLGGLISVEREFGDYKSTKE